MIVFEFPNIIDILINDLGSAFGEFWELLGALLSLCGLLGAVYFFIMILIGKHIGVKPPVKTLIISLILLTIFGPDNGLRYFKIQ
ncbi:hypothetical protein ES706_06546 [subsurface metagenome]